MSWEKEQELIHWLLFRACNLDIISNYSMPLSFCTFNNVRDIFNINICRKEFINADVQLLLLLFSLPRWTYLRMKSWVSLDRILATFLFMLHLSRSLPRLLYHWSNMIKRSMTKQGWSFSAQAFSFPRSLQIVRIMIPQRKIHESFFNHSGLVSVALDDIHIPFFQPLSTDSLPSLKLNCFVISAARVVRETRVSLITYSTVVCVYHVSSFWSSASLSRYLLLT